MIRDDEHWLELTDAFQEAALDGGRWYGAISAFAEATGSQHGQLVCMRDDGVMPLNMITNVDPALPDAFVAAGGSDPHINPRRRAGITRPLLTVLAESDFITPDEYKRDLHYQEFAVPWDVPYICLTTLERRHDLRVGLAAIRTKRQGHIDDEGRRAFASLAPHVRSAVRTSLALTNSHEALLSDTFEAVSIPAFICDRTGIVRRLTASAEALVTDGSGLQLKLGKLTAQHANEASALSDAIGAAAERRPHSPSSRAVVIRSPQAGRAPIALDVISLPCRRLPFSFDARVLVLVRSAAIADDKRRSALLQSVYGMTPAEIEIAQALLDGKSAQEISALRAVSVGTVRTQIKALFAKTGSSRQVDLVARLGKL